MHDQATKLRELVRATILTDPALLPGPPVIVASGATPDDGAAEIISGLAAELGRLGKSVVMVDADPVDPRLAELLEVQPANALADVLTGAKHLVEGMVQASDRVSLLPTCPGWSSVIDSDSPSRLALEISSLGDRADVVLIDAGNQASPWTERLWRMSQQILLVCTPNRDSITEAYAKIKAAQSPLIDQKVRLVVNRCDDADSAALASERMAETCRSFLALGMKQGVHVASDCTARSGRRMPAAPTEYQRCLRLLAAEVAADVRALALRMIDRPDSPDIQDRSVTDNASDVGVDVGEVSSSHC